MIFPAVVGNQPSEAAAESSIARMARLRIGELAPPINLPGADGASRSLDDYTAQPVAVVFSCCHCPYVIAWEDRLNDVARDYRGRAGLVAINSNDHIGDSLQDMERRAQEKSFVFPFLRDESQEAARSYGASRTPEVFVLGANRRLIYHGDPGWAVPYLRQALDAALAGKAPPCSETPPVGCTIKWKP